MSGSRNPLIDLVAASLKDEDKYFALWGVDGGAKRYPVWNYIVATAINDLTGRFEKDNLHGFMIELRDKFAVLDSKHEEREKSVFFHPKKVWVEDSAGQYSIKTMNNILFLFQYVYMYDLKSYEAPTTLDVKLDSSYKWVCEFFNELSGENFSGNFQEIIRSLAAFLLRPSDVKSLRFLGDDNKESVEEAVAEVPVVEIAVEVPVEEIAAEVPVAEIAAEVPVVEAVAEVPVVEIVAEVPVVEIVAEVPVETAATEVPVEKVVPAATDEISHTVEPSPNIFQRTWSRFKNFANEHPVLAVLLGFVAVTLVAAAVVGIIIGTMGAGFIVGGVVSGLGLIGISTATTLATFLSGVAATSAVAAALLDVAIVTGASWALYGLVAVVAVVKAVKDGGEKTESAIAEKPALSEASNAESLSRDTASSASDAPALNAPVRLTRSRSVSDAETFKALNKVSAFHHDKDDVKKEAQNDKKDGDSESEGKGLGKK